MAAVIVGATFSLKLTVLLLWVVLDAVPLASKIALDEDGTTVITSLPFGMPEKPTPNVY